MRNDTVVSPLIIPPWFQVIPNRSRSAVKLPVRVSAPAVASSIRPVKVSGSRIPLTTRPIGGFQAVAQRLAEGLGAELAGAGT
jgi:hypothetical protein